MAARGPRCADCGLELMTAGVSCPRCGGLTVPLRREPPAIRTGAHESALDPAARYQVLDSLGRGAMGIVYKVKDLELDEVIAMKVLDPLYQSTAELVPQFKQELKLARRINHPNVARVFDLVNWQGSLAISQEYIEGRSLESVAGSGPLALPVIVRYLRYIGSGLQAAHRLGVIHRDLKPANVLIDTRDEPRLMDFGLAVLAGETPAEPESQIFGTPWYMSPEQIFRPTEVDHRTDIYSLGVILFRLATGSVPYKHAAVRDTLRAHLQAPIPQPSERNPTLPAAFDHVVARCMAKDPEERYSSVRDIHGDLTERLTPATLRKPPVAPAPRPRAGARVLVVDDDPAMRELLQATLGALGCQVMSAADGYQGVQQALDGAPELILLDLMMPVLDGREALRILKSNPGTAPIPVIILTGVTDPEEAVFSREAGAVQFVNKPVEPDVLELLVEKYAGRGAGP